MKIFHVIDSLLTGGVNSFVYDLCAAQKEAGEDVCIIVILKNDEKADITPVPDGVPAAYLNAPGKKAAILRYIPKLRKVIKRMAAGEETICNLHLKLSVLMGGLAAAGLKNVRCVETYHNSYRHYHLEFFLMQPFIKKYITVSETARQEMFDRFHAPKDKVIAAPNGIDREMIRRLAGEKQEHSFVQLISVGRLSREKNLSVPAEALSDRCNKDLRYEIIGDGEEKAKVEAARKRNEYITLAGTLPRDEVLKHLASADLLIMPSLWEGRSILQLEAMALDLPMIISDVPGLREPFGELPLRGNESWRRCVFGYLVKPKAKEAYLAAVQDFVMHPNLDDDMRPVIEAVSKKNGSEYTVEKYKAAYISVINGRK